MTIATIVAIAVWMAWGSSSQAQLRRLPFVPAEARDLQVRDPAGLAAGDLPALPTPPTVQQPGQIDNLYLTLDEAIRIALQNAEIVRVLAGVGSASSGRTIYDPAISNTNVDLEQSRFDPTVIVNNRFDRAETPVGIPDPADATRTLIDGTRRDDYNLQAGIDKTTPTGGLAALNVNTNPARFQPGVFPLNPQNRSSLELSYTQPLLQGGGLAVNLSPIVVARIDTERSYFQFKDSVQELVRGVIAGYWDLVFARVDLWAREQQVAQSKFAFERAQERKEQGFADLAEVAQTEAAYQNFRASLIAAQASVLNREMALRSILGLPPAGDVRVVPVTPPTADLRLFDWDNLLVLAEQRRPDIIELKLILEADQQLLLQSRNQALPRVDAVASYRWNGLDGEMPVGDFVSSRPGQFTDWTLAVNFSVPLGLRRARSQLRRQELLIMRDQANLQQGLHNTAHLLAGSLRDLAQSYEQYRAFSAAKNASRQNLDLQFAEYLSGRSIVLNALQAIGSWGDAVSAEAQALTAYNTQLANLERRTGTILETHGIRFYEERYRSIGPLGRLHPPASYPRSLNFQRDFESYPATDRPAEESFDLTIPDLGKQLLEPLDPPPPTR